MPTGEIGLCGLHGSFTGLSCPTCKSMTPETTPSPANLSGDSAQSIKVVDAAYVRGHITAIHYELSAMLNLYLGPRTRDCIQTLQADLDAVAMAYYREGQSGPPEALA